MSLNISKASRKRLSVKSEISLQQNEKASSFSDEDNLFEIPLENSFNENDEESDTSESLNEDVSGYESEDSASGDEEDVPSDGSQKDSPEDEIDDNSKSSEKCNKEGHNVPIRDEYEYDTSDEEDIRNTVGNVPMNWYDDYDHLGYDWDAKKIIKPNKGSEIDNFLKRMDDPNFWRTVVDKQTGQDVVLNDEDIELIKRLEAQKIPDSTFDEYSPWIEWFSSQTMDMPLRKFPEHKRSFVPSRDEMKKVSKYVHALKMGWMKTRKEIKRQLKEKEKKGPQFYMLWQNDDVPEEMRRIRNNISAPKRPLPGHAESYNPPEEYLFSEKEQKKWDREKRSLGNKKLHFVPEKFHSLREVPAYKRYIRERFLRCLDLYMCPRAIKLRLTIEPEALVPQLPSPKDLQPFPTTMSLVYRGHEGPVRSISVDPKGQYLASTSYDETVKFWEVSTARCFKTVKIEGAGKSVSWNPNSSITLVAVAVDNKVLLINPGLGDELNVKETDLTLKETPPEGQQTSDNAATAVQWEMADEGDYDLGIRVILKHFKEVKQVVWHAKGDYFATLVSGGENKQVLMHRLSKRQSQLPFSKPKGLVQSILFHPIRPYFFVATQKSIRVYDMVKQEMTKKLCSNCQWISSMAIHSGGDNLLVGTYDRKVLWFDMDLSTKPYKSLALHTAAVRSVAFHRKYPLFASSSDDKSVIVSHGMVYNDLDQNALIVPLKKLSYHETVDDFTLFDVLFHPSQPWLFSSGADATIRLYT